MFVQLAELIIQGISLGGYPVLFILMVLESMIFPIPSELVMPFAGFLTGNGAMSMWLIILVSTFGSLVGSIISYWLGLFGGRKFINRFGKYFLLDQEHLEWTEKFFKKHGSKTIFISRFIPVVRHLISIPAGMGKMDLKKFAIYTVIGAGLWNAFLAYVGVWLKSNWTVIHDYSFYIDVVVVAILVIFLTYYIYRLIKKKR
jgi:membrane protein DedA with SNARE-associated domain